MLALGVLDAGCFTIHSERNAPGVIDVQRPPKQMECETPERPSDPGENTLFISAGLLGGIGAAIDSKEDTGFQADVGLEGSIFQGRSDESHTDDFPVGATSFMDKSFGFNFGWVFARRQGEAGPLYLEIQGRYRLIGLATGVSWISGTHAIGPQVTAFCGPVYIRYVHFQGTSDEITFGLIFKISLAFVTSR